jgi:hypothetical protein
MKMAIQQKNSYLLKGKVKSVKKDDKPKMKIPLVADNI